MKLTTISAFIGLIMIYAGLDAMAKNINPSIPFISAFFFLSLSFLNHKNGNKSESQYISFAASVVAFSYSIMGLVTGELSTRRHQFLRSEDPQGFWFYFTILVILGLAALSYGVWQLYKARNNTKPNLPFKRDDGLALKK